MRRWKNLCWLLMAVLMMPAGCSRQKKEQGYMVYYTNTSGTRLMEVSYNPAAQNFDEMMQELMGQLASAPSGYISAMPSDVMYNGYERGIDALRIDFSQEYYNLSNTEEVLFRAAVVKTISQIPGVTKVMFTVEKEPLRNMDGEQVPTMDANTFIDTKEGGINSYLYTTLELYFANPDGDRLVQEMRELHYSSNMVLERVVVEQLLKGPEASDRKAVAASTAQIQNIYVQNGICNINFNTDFNKSAESTVEPEVALYAIVNSICATCDNITGVQFEINGERDVMFRDKVDLNQVFSMNTSWLEADEIETEEVREQAAVSADIMQEAETAAETQKTETPVGNTVVGVEPSLTEG